MLKNTFFASISIHLAFDDRKASNCHKMSTHTYVSYQVNILHYMFLGFGYMMLYHIYQLSNIFHTGLTSTDLEL